MNIFVAKLSSDTTGEDLNNLFSQFGEVVSSKVIFDRETGHSKRFGFVEMIDEGEGDIAINQLNDTQFGGSQIVVKKAKPRENIEGRERRPAGGRDSRGEGRRDFSKKFSKNV